jgi:metal-responsive CopG/Arc/MetJ family transcriptional regulator
MVYSTHMIRTQVYLPNTLYQDITLVAQKEKKAAAQVIRELLTESLESKKRQTSIGTALLRLTSVNAHAPKDLSQQIDTYLYNG